MMPAPQTVDELIQLSDRDSDKAWEVIYKCPEVIAALFITADEFIRFTFHNNNVLVAEVLFKDCYDQIAPLFKQADHVISLAGGTFMPWRLAMHEPKRTADLFVDDDKWEQFKGRADQGVIDMLQPHRDAIKKQREESVTRCSMFNRKRVKRRKVVRKQHVATSSANHSRHSQ